MALYIVATPIGNLGDISIRALDTLKSVDVIAAEDTRVTRKLLARYEIHTPLVTYHQHSRPGDLTKIIRVLTEGKSVAYVTDAGTPGISDPCSWLIHEALEALPELQIIPIPGASALSALVSIADRATDHFLFLGFPPYKKGRKTFFEKMSTIEYPVVLYESPHRIGRTMKDMMTVGLGERECIIARELTKIHETVLRGTVEDVFKHIEEVKPRGEFVCLIYPEKR